VAQKLSVVFEGIPATFEMDFNQYMFRVRAVPLENESNEIDRILLVESNITQQKNAEKEIYNSLQKEKQLNEMKSKFVSMASHEFRTPLSTILSSSSLINKYTEAGKTDRITKHTDRIQNNVRNLTMILNDFLSLEKLENNGLNTAPEEFNLIDCIQEVKEDMEMLTRANQVITLDNQMQSEMITTDRFVIQNIMTNLVSNAIKYSGNDGKICIKVSKESGVLRIEVTDNGIGISKEDQEQLFNRFYRASNAGNVQGTGLGLHIVKRYIALLNGELIFESELGKGSTFGLSLNL
jgi:signal transduction histidine kinase